MLALSALVSLANGGETRSSLCETALALFPRMATLHTLLKLWLSDGSDALCRYNFGLLNLFGLRDGSIGLLETRLKWSGPLVQSSPNLPSASASINSGFLLNIVSPGGRIGIENKEMLKTIEQNMPRYIQVLLEATGHLLQLLKEGLLDPSRVAGLLEGPVAKETLLDFLMIVSDLARMSKDFYVPIDKAGLVGFLKNYLSSEDPDIRGKACSAIGNMCRHSSYFYSPFEANKVIQLLVDRCSDPDKRTRKFACFAVGNAAYHNDMLYDELRGSIPQLTTLLLGPEEDKTKGNAAGALVTLSPSRRDALTESPLRIVLFALRKMCDHAICRNFLRSSELLPVIVHLRQSPDPTISEYASAIATRACQA
nr:unnamed protein product [Digitaria exilis]